jgi:ABC-type branched-subunit amino acid transport system substrate-binding protein
LILKTHSHKETAMIKRHLGGTAVIFAFLLAHCAQAQDFKGNIYIGQISPLSGPAASIGVPLTQGAAVMVRKVNSKGGVGGSRLVLLDKDDGFLAKRTMEGAQDLLANKSKPIVALLNVVGSPNSGDLISNDVLKGHDLSLVGAFTGSTSVRAMKSPNVYFVRAGVAGEAERIVNHFVTLGIDRIALLHPEDTFGRDALEQMRIALAARKLELTAVGTYLPATTEMDKAVRTILDKKPQAVAIFATGAAAAKFIAAFRSTGSAGDSVMLTTSSSTSADYLISKLPLQQVRGVGVLQAVLPLSKSEVPIVKARSVLRLV